MPLARPLPRRTLVRLAVVGSGAVALAGCGVLDRVPRPAPRRREDDADEPLVAAALTEQQRVLATAVATRSVHPALAATLDPVVEHHRTHVTVLGGSPDDAGEPSATATAPDPSATASPTLPTISADPAVALAELGAAEQAAVEARASDTTAAASGDLARVLAAMAAGQAQHVVVLAAAASSLGDDS